MDGRRVRYAAEVTRAVGLHLLQKGRLRRGELQRWSEMLGVSPRTLRKWRDQALAPPKMGRPRLARSRWRAAVGPVARTWKSQGRSSGLPRVKQRMKELGIPVPITIARELLRELKVRHARVVARKRSAQRMSVTVHARDALWSEDASQLGRDAAGKVEALAAKDVATTRVIEHSIGGPACGEDVVRLLERARLVRGALPLVLGLDNGPANTCELVCSYLRAHLVIPLWNLPYTPEHNAWIESTFGELDGELEASGESWVGCAEASRGPVSSPEAGLSPTRRHFERCVPRVLGILNGRARPSRGGWTAEQLDRILPRAEDLVDRARFYDTVCAAIERAVQGIENARARRRAEREAVWCTLEQFGLVTRTRGRRPAACSKAERLS